MRPKEYETWIGELLSGGPQTIYQWVHVIEQRMADPDCDPNRTGPDVAWKPPYYRALAAASKLIKDGIAIDLGTRWGHSAAALARAERKVLTFDVSNAGRKSREAVDLPPNVSPILLATAEDVVTTPPFEAASIVFLDIDHKGWLEAEVYQELDRCGFRGLLLCDDLDADFIQGNRDNGMRRFWRLIHRPKATTNWHGPWGFGVVLFE